MFDLARLIRRSTKYSFSSTEWHDEAVRLMAKEADVPKSLVIRAAIEMLSSNFSVGVFRSLAPQEFSERWHDPDEQADSVSDLLFSSLGSCPTGRFGQELE